MALVLAVHLTREESELAALEEHLLACAACATRASEIADYVDAIGVRAIIGNFDLE